MRQLASIQRITEITPIEGADAVEKARVLGWNIVVRKGEHQPGDLVVYCEIDSLLPECPDFEFLRPNCYRAPVTHGGQVILPAGFRIKTRKIRGQVSQGICFPLSILPDYLSDKAEEGLDVTVDLGIVKYELPEDLGGVHIQGVKRSTFPVHLLPKADETRVQVLGGLVERFKGTVFNKTEKLDGSSFTAIMNVDDFMICSRNQLLDPADLSHTFCALAKRIGLESKMRALQERGSFAIQGEVVGPSIQKNKYKLAEHELYVFDIYRIPYEMYVEPEEMREFAMRVGLKTVPNLGDFILDHSIDDLVALSSGASALNLMTEREGIVLRPAHGTPTDSKGNRVSMKVINPKFLLKFDE